MKAILKVLKENGHHLPIEQRLKNPDRTYVSSDWFTKIFQWIVVLATLVQSTSYSADYVVYSIHKAIELGSPGEVTQRDYYVNIGLSQGVQAGSKLQVYRKVATYDLLSEKFYRDVAFPIAELKVIHAETHAAIARFDRMLPPDKTPAIEPRAIMVGDIVRPTGR